MSNIQLMKKALNKNVIAPLLEQGFTGKWPNFRKVYHHHIELLTFQTNKYGGSFTVELSAIFPNANNKNYTNFDDKPLSELNVWDTNVRYRLKGMYDGWFYYRDLYKKYIFGFGVAYFDVNETKANEFIMPKGYKLVQKFDTKTAENICFIVNKQLKKGFKWLNHFVKKHT